MALYFITYEINNLDNKNCIDNKIQELYENAVNILDNGWMIKSLESTYNILDQLKKCINMKDSILVVKTTEEIHGWIDDDIVNGISRLKNAEYDYLNLSI